MHSFINKFFYSSILVLTFFCFNSPDVFAAAPAVATAVIQNVTGSAFDIYLTGTSFNAFVSSTNYNANSTDLNGITFNTYHPTSAVIDENLTIKHLTVTFPIAAGSESSSNLTIAANTIRNSTTLNSLITKAINPLIVLTEVTPITSRLDYTPNYTFNSTTAGTIAYGGDCSSSDTTADAGDNTITFNTLAEGVHSNCTIQVTSSGGDVSGILTVSSFTLGVGSSYLAEYWNLDEATDAPTFPVRDADYATSLSNINVDWGGGSPDSSIHNDGFVGRFTKTVTLTAGVYDFNISSDDGNKIKVDGNTIMDNWSSNTINTTSTTLTAGTHTIVVEYYENGGGAHISFNYFRELEGTGTSEDPYQINTCDDLQSADSHLTSHFKLMSDVDCSATSGWNTTTISDVYIGNGNTTKTVFSLVAKNIDNGSPFSVRYWNGSPMDPADYTVDYTNGTVTFDTAPGYNSLYASFTYNKGFLPLGYVSNTGLTGEFDGNDHTISNLTIQSPSENNKGLFMYSNGNIHDLTVTNASVSGYSQIGIIAGYAQDAIFSNITISGSVQGLSDKVGGIVGANQQGSIITNANSSATVGSGSSQNTGGISGANGGIIRNSTSSGTISGTESVGGISGKSGGGIIDSHSTANISGTESVGGAVGFSDGGYIINTYATGNVTGTNEGIGGLLGKNAHGFVRQSYATGNVVGATKVGGLSGANGGTIENSYSRGSVTGTSQIGGLVGRNGGIISNSYATGEMSIATSDIGGLVGYTDYSDGNPAIQNSFWDTETSSNNESAFGTGKTTSEMKTQTTFTNASWDFDNVWTISSGQYPTLVMGNIFESGTGTDNDPYHITTCTQLQNIGAFLVGDFVLDNNINCTESSSWSPRTVSDINLGTMNGASTTISLGHHKISSTDNFSIYLNGDSLNSELYTVNYNTGVVTFDTTPDVDTSVVANFTYYQGYYGAGDDGDKSFRGTLDGDSHIISNLYIDRPNDNAIGLIRYMYNATIENLYLQDVDITGEQEVGAFAGMSEGDGDENQTNITNVGVSGSIKGQEFVAGIVGRNKRDSTISKAFSNADVTESGNSKVGGIAGANGGTIENSYSTGRIVGDDQAGGVAGRNGGAITKSYSTGLVTNDGVPNGGLLGYFEQGSVDDSFWDMETSNTEDGGAGTGLTTEQMKNISSFTNTEYNAYLTNVWDFSEIWNIDSDHNNGYPYLRGQTFFVENVTPIEITNTTSTVNGTTATITWGTNTPGSTKVIYGFHNDHLDSNSNNADLATEHSAEISNLLVCTRYFFKAESTDGSSNTTQSDLMSFMTSGCTGSSDVVTDEVSSHNPSESSETSLASEDRNIRVQLPSGFADTDSDIIIQIKSIPTSGVISDVGSPSGFRTAGGISFDVKAYVGSDVLDSFDTPITISYTYSNEDIFGINESSLWMYHYHNGEWLPLDNCTVTTSDNIIACTTNSFSVFSVFGHSSASNSGVSSGSSAKNRVSNLTSMGKVAEADKIKATFLTPSSPYVFSQNLTVGTNGDDIKELQKFLNTHGFTVALTGPGSVGNETTMFGAGTKAALIKFQIANNITPAIGFFGPTTRNIISTLIGGKTTTTSITSTSTHQLTVRDLESGMSGDDVTKLQEFLIKQATGLEARSLADKGATGYFGSLTKKAVTEYQIKAGISPATGRFGPMTRAQIRSSGTVGLWW
ncbi:MAG: GLUG motif-containing protein [Patescibacteria group bacterium]